MTFSKNCKCSLFNGIAKPFIMLPNISKSSPIPLCLHGNGEDKIRIGARRGGMGGRGEEREEGRGIGGKDKQG